MLDNIQLSLITIIYHKDETDESDEVGVEGRKNMPKEKGFAIVLPTTSLRRKDCFELQFK